MLRAVLYLLRIAGTLGCLVLAIQLSVQAIGWLLMAFMFMATVILVFVGVAFLIQVAVCLLCVQGLMRAGQMLLGFPAQHPGWLIERGAKLANRWRCPLFRKAVLIVGVTLVVLVITFRFPNVPLTPQEYDMVISLVIGPNRSFLFPWDVAAGLMLVGVVQDCMAIRVARLSES